MAQRQEGQRAVRLLLCLDGSDCSRRAIVYAGRPLAGEGVVLTVWESLGSAVLRHARPARRSSGATLEGIAEDVAAEPM